MNWRWTVGALGALFLLTGCGDALVGGQCATGFVARDGACAVADASSGDAVVDAPRDVGSDTADDAVDAISPSDVVTADAVGDGSPLADARTDTGCGSGLTPCGGTCIDTTSDVANCGACGNTCAASDQCAAGACVPLCTPPAVNCGGVCVDLETNELNCGACGLVCPSGVCNAGVCRDALVGHAVLIGHNYINTRPDPDRIVGNAVFLAATTAPRVLAYVGQADPTAVAHVNAAVSTTAGARSWTHTTLVDPTTVSSTLSIDHYDVMLVYEQTRATDAGIATLAASMGAALESFAHAGGVVIVLDGPTANGGTFPVMAATGLLHPTAVRNIDAQLVSLATGAGADALAVGVRTTYRATTTSVAFTSSDSGVVFEQGTDPVVLHLAVGP